MARVFNGILSEFKGTVGNIIGSSRNGVNYIRLRPTKVKNPQTVGQLTQRMKFGLSAQFLGPLSSLISIGLKQNVMGLNPLSYAKICMMKRSFIGEYPNIEIDYSTVLLSEGNLLEVSKPKAALVDQELKFTWVYEESESFTGYSANDAMVLVVYNITKRKLGSSVAKAFRSEEQGSIKIPSIFEGDTLLAYLFVVSEDGTTVSNSQFAGRFEMPKP